MDRNVEKILSSMPIQADDARYGEISLVEVRRMHRQAVVSLLKKHSSLTGSEVRFLRERMSYSRQRVADSVGISRDMLEGWEQDSVHIIPAIDVKLRLLSAEHLGIILDVRSVLCALVRQERRETERLRLAKAAKQAPRAGASLSR